MEKSPPYIQLQKGYHRVVFGHCFCSICMYAIFHFSFNCLLVSYDSTLLKVIPTKGLRLSAAAKINVDLYRIADWGILNFNLQSLRNTVCVSLKCDVEEHPPLYK